MTEEQKPKQRQRIPLKRADGKCNCWSCNKLYPITEAVCSCGAINANVDFEGAKKQFKERIAAEEVTKTTSKKEDSGIEIDNASYILGGRG